MTRKIGLAIAHYQERPGACHLRLCEHAESRLWTRTVEQLLTEREIEFFEAPIGPLKPKVSAINAQGCALALEIHFNACGNCGASGTETLYYPGSVVGKAAATMMQKRLVQALRLPDRGVKEGWYKMDRPGVVDWYGDEDGDEMPDYFLKATNCPALILEPEFIEQLSGLFGATAAQMRKDGCAAIVKGIEDFLG